MHGFDIQRKHGSQPAGTRLTVFACVLSVGLSPLASGALPSSLARAAEPLPRVLLLPTEVDGRVARHAAGKVSELVASVFSLDGRFTWLAPDALTRPLSDRAPAAAMPPAARRAPTPRASAGPLARASREHEQGRGHARAGRHAAAIKAFTAAIRSYTEGLGELADLGPYREVLVDRALAYLAAGYADNADEEFLRVLALDPAITLPAEASETARAAFGRVATSVAGSAATLTVTVETPAAVDSRDVRVVLDGRAEEPSPAVFSDLPRGEHVVQVVAEGFAPVGRLVTVGDEPVRLSVSLAPDPGRASPTRSRPSGVAIGPAEPWAPLPDLGDAGLLLRSGDVGAAFDAWARPMASHHGLASVVMTRLAPRATGRGVVLSALVWSPSAGVALVAEAELSEDLSGLQLAVLDLAEQAASAVMRFPEARRVASVPPLAAEGAPPDLAAADPSSPPSVSEPGPVPTPEAGGGALSSSVPQVPSDPPASALATPEPVAIFTPPEAVRATRRGRGAATAARAGAPETPFHASWWFWTLTVGVLAGGTTAAVLATQGRGGPATWRATVSW